MTVNGADEDDAGLARYCAQRFFVEDRSKVEIAEELGISRFKVARLLSIARETGLVTITINEDLGPGVDYAQLLRERLALRDVVVLTERPGLRGVGRAAAAPGRGPGGPVLGVGWGRAIDAVVSAFPQVDVPVGVDVVQLAGGIVGPTPALDPSGVAARAAATLEGRLTPLHAPAFLSSETTRRALLSEPGIAAATAAFERITVALVGIGALGAETDSSLVAGDALPVTARSELTGLGAVADVVCHFFDASGRAVTAWEGRTIAVSLDQLRAADCRIGVAAGRSKATAVLAALRSGVLTSLVTDNACARAIVDVISRPRRGPAATGPSAGAPDNPRSTYR